LTHGIEQTTDKGWQMKDIHILFVDDEPVILRAIGRLLYKEHYSLHFAENGVEALEVMAKTPIQVLVTDMRMPKMDGLSLLRQVKELYPDTVRMALSGYLQIGQLLPCINSGEIFRFIIKPAQMEELKQALQDAIDYYLLRKDRIALVRELQEKNEKLEQALEQQKEVETQLRQLSIMDDVTELYNRRFLSYSMEQQFEQCKRCGRDLSCLIIDLDHFKQINEEYGYDFGDFMLKQFAACLLKMISATDMGFRYGGARFIFLLPATGLEKTLALGKTILEWCRTTPFLDNSSSVTVAVSIGAASLIRHHPQTPDELILFADKMLAGDKPC
jgi:diguanylate cyclase (GGDEF)-like protein